jgi:hypothetical protein
MSKNKSNKKIEKGVFLTVRTVKNTKTNKLRYKYSLKYGIWETVDTLAEIGQVAMVAGYKRIDIDNGKMMFKTEELTKKKENN